jgi:hypothetical protein
LCLWLILRLYDVSTNSIVINVWINTWWSTIFTLALRSQNMIMVMLKGRAEDNMGARQPRRLPAAVSHPRSVPEPTAQARPPHCRCPAPLQSATPTPCPYPPLRDGRPFPAAPLPLTATVSIAIRRNQLALPAAQPELITPHDLPGNQITAWVITAPALPPSLQPRAGTI